MTFTSYSYYLFLPVVYLVFYFSSQRWRWLVPVAARPASDLLLAPEPPL